MAKRLQRRSGFESLEAKRLMAGDVTVGVVDGHLLVRGDAESNQVAITAGPERGSYFVVGLGETTVSERPDPGRPDGEGSGEAPANRVLVEGVRRGAEIRMGDGNDTVAIHDAGFRGGVRIATGAGNDNVIIGTPLDRPTDPPPPEGTGGGSDAANLVRIGRSLEIRTGAGDDNVRVQNARIADHMHIATGEDNDAVVIGERPDRPEPPPQPTGAAGGEGDSMRPVASVVVGGRVGIHTDGGNDDVVIANAKSRGNMNVGTGGGDDHVGVVAAHARALHIVTGHGDGADTVRVADSRAGRLRIRTGAGDDQVGIADSIFHDIGVALGGGDDSLVIGNLRARRAFFHGGGGDNDTIERVAPSNISRVRIRGFEPNRDEATV